MAIDTEERKPAKGRNNPGDTKGNKKVIIIVLAVLGVLIMLSVIGTIAAGFFGAKVTETIIESATGGEVDIDTKGNGNVTFKDKDGNTTMETGVDTELPEDFPSDVPIYEGAKITSASSFKASDNGQLFSIRLEVDDPAKDVYDFYKDAFSTNGWETTTTQTMNGNYTVHGTHEAANLFGTATINSDGDKTTVLLGAKDQLNSD